VQRPTEKACSASHPKQLRDPSPVSISRPQALPLRGHTAPRSKLRGSLRHARRSADSKSGECAPATVLPASSCRLRPRVRVPGCDAREIQEILGILIRIATPRDYRGITGLLGEH
jgi:hypothetical protein